MKKMKYFTIIVTSLFLLSSCVTKQEHEDVLDTWIGSSEGAIVASWVVPSSFYEANGLRYLTWSNVSQGVIGGTPGYITTDNFGNVYSYPGTAPIPVTYNCNITMIVENDVIINWQYKGNNCYDF